MTMNGTPNERATVHAPPAGDAPMAHLVTPGAIDVTDSAPTRPTDGAPALTRCQLGPVLVVARNEELAVFQCLARYEFDAGAVEK